MAEGFLPGGAWEQDRGFIIKDDAIYEMPAEKDYDREYDKEYSDEQISAEGNANDPFFDPREEGLVSDVKDQGRFSLCWDYAAVSSAESLLIRNGYEKEIDLSEYHGAALTYLRQIATGTLQTSSTFEDFCNGGGSPSYIWQLWEEGFGPGLEGDYPGIDTISENALPDMIDAGKICDLSSTKTIGGEIVDIKEAVRHSGAVTALYYSYALYYEDRVNDSLDSSYYMPYPVKSRNHAISIVGWDDDFPAECFVNTFRRMDDGSEAELLNGAWLCKNSWGKKGYKSPDEASGYYWISYYDRSLSDFMAISFGGVSGDEGGDGQMTEDPERNTPNSTPEDLENNIPNAMPDDPESNTPNVTPDDPKSDIPNDFQDDSGSKIPNAMTGDSEGNILNAMTDDYEDDTSRAMTDDPGRSLPNATSDNPEDNVSKAMPEEPYMQQQEEEPEAVAHYLRKANPDRYKESLICVDDKTSPRMNDKKKTPGKGKKLKTIKVKRKGIVYLIKGGRASIKKVTGKKRRLKIPAYVRYKGRKYPVTKIWRDCCRSTKHSCAWGSCDWKNRKYYEIRKTYKTCKNLMHRVLVHVDRGDQQKTTFGRDKTRNRKGLRI
ncbi:MAG: hypothetical protein K6E75_03180 [Lachnospiraceae bacterium]|nr:hypothetical protein [Lachnospiraceae bacterium]